MSDEFLTLTLWVVLFFVIAAGLCALSAAFIFLLWNWLMPIIFGLPQITFWQAFGIGLLSSILFKTPSFSRSNKE